MQENQIAKRALKIAIVCLFISGVLNLLVLSTLLVQIDSIAGLTHKVKMLEQEIRFFSSQNEEIIKKRKKSY